MPYSAGRLLASKIAYSAPNSAGKIYPSLSWWRKCGNKLSNVKGFIIFRPGEGVTSSNKDNSVKFLVKKYNKAFRGISFLRIREKPFSQISYWKSFSSSNLKVLDIILISNVSTHCFFLVAFFPDAAAFKVTTPGAFIVVCAPSLNVST